VSGAEKKRSCVAANMPFLLPLRLVDSRDYLTCRERPQRQAGKTLNLFGAKCRVDGRAGDTPMSEPSLDCPGRAP
jgi:hypothetical protein